MADMGEMIEMVMWILIPVMIFAEIMKRVGSKLPHRQLTFEVPRDPMERLIIQLKKAAKVNKTKTRQALTITGDIVREGKRTGFVTGGVVPETNEYVFLVKSSWWKIWRKAAMYIVEPEFCSDLFGKEISVTGRGWYRLGDFFYVIPILEKSKDIEQIWIRRAKNQQVRMERLLGTDITTDMNFNTLFAMRGSFQEAQREQNRIGPMSQVTQEELDSQQGGGNYGG